MHIFLKIIILITLSLLGGLAYALTTNFLILANIVPFESVGENFGYEMTSKAVFVWIIAVILGITSLFIKQKWRYVLLLCPLVAPSIFALLFSLSQ